MARKKLLVLSSGVLIFFLYVHNLLAVASDQDIVHHHHHSPDSIQGMFSYVVHVGTVFFLMQRSLYLHITQFHFGPFSAPLYPPPSLPPSLSFPSFLSLSPEIHLVSNSQQVSD